MSKDNSNSNSNSTEDYRATPARIAAGRPTEPDCRRLDEAFPTLEAGTVVRYEDIAQIIGEDRKSNRFAVVLSAWRKRLFRLRNVDFRAVAGVGLRVLPEWDRVVCANGDFHGATRAVARSARRLGAVRTETLSPEQQRVATHAARVISATLQEATSGRKALVFEFRAAELPAANPKIRP
jgi:hypothetical protein